MSVQWKAAFLEEQQCLQNLTAQALHLADGQPIRLACILARPRLVPLGLQQKLIIIIYISPPVFLAYLKDEILETAARIEGRHEAGIVMRAVAQEAQVEHGINVRMMQWAEQLH